MIIISSLVPEELEGVNPFTVNPSGQALRTSPFRMNP